MKVNETIGVFSVGAVMGMVVASVITSNLVDKVIVKIDRTKYTKNTIIKNGCAEYNSTNGKFQWIKRD